VIVKSRTARWSDVGKTRFNCVDDWKVAPIAVPEASAAVDDRNPLPVIVTSASEPPPGMENADRDVMTGTGFPTVNGTLFEIPPPGPGDSTETC
jgi:hypothetical protein